MSPVLSVEIDGKPVPPGSPADVIAEAIRPLRAQPATAPSDREIATTALAGLADAGYSVVPANSLTEWGVGYPNGTYSGGFHDLADEETAREWQRLETADGKRAAVVRRTVTYGKWESADD